jgi:hypothetical protein
MGVSLGELNRNKIVTEAKTVQGKIQFFLARFESRQS